MCIRDRFMAEISNTENAFLDTIIYKGTSFHEKSVQYTHYTSCHPASVKKGFVKGEAFRTLRILGTNSSETMFEDNISNLKKRLINRG